MRNGYNSEQVLTVAPSLPAGNLKELIALAKSEPGELNYATVGSGGTTHIASELLNLMAGINTKQINYKGAGPAMLEFLAGRVDIYFDSLTIMKQNISSGKYRMLGIATKKRSSLAPEIPTLDEGGLKGFESVGWFGVLAPAGTAPAVIARMNQEINAIIAMPDVKKRLTEMGAIVTPLNGKQFWDYVGAEIKKWAAIVEKAGVKPE